MMKLSFSYMKFSVKNSSNFNKFSFKNFYFQNPDRHGAGDPHIVAKRVINTIGRVLRESDPHRWDGVPITFETSWVNEDDANRDVRTSILIHDALEKEFNFDIDDKKILLKNIKDSVNFVLEAHAAI